MYDIDVTTWFLMLVFDTITTECGFNNTYRIILLSLYEWLLILSLLFLFNK